MHLHEQLYSYAVLPFICVSCHLTRIMERIFMAVSFHHDLGHKTCLTPPIFIEVHVARQESERSCICVL